MLLVSKTVNRFTSKRPEHKQFHTRGIFYRGSSTNWSSRTLWETRVHNDRSSGWTWTARLLFYTPIWIIYCLRQTALSIWQYSDGLEQEHTQQYVHSSNTSVSGTFSHQKCTQQHPVNYYRSQITKLSPPAFNAAYLCTYLYCSRTNAWTTNTTY